jgi:hypothetical protein
MKAASFTWGIDAAGILAYDIEGGLLQKIPTATCTFD